MDTTARQTQIWNALDRKLRDLFGEPFPKGKALGLDGSIITPLAASRLGLSLMQFPPQPDRMSWVYVTHGLSSLTKSRQELALHWRPRENAVPVRALADAARLIQESGRAIAPGEFLPAAQQNGAGGLKHWLACAGGQELPCPGGKVRLTVLVGISEAEFQHAQKVNPQLADGPQVLLEALRAANVFPVSDPERQCLTRRGDFHRLWEAAFRGVREGKK